MKRIVLSIVLLSSLITTAQITVKPGVRAGVNISNFTNFGTNSKTDFYVGGFAQIDFARFYNMQPELNYSRQGANQNGEFNESIDIHYLSLTIANKFYPIRENGFNLIVGPSLAIKVGDDFENNYDEIEGFDLVFMGGIGYDFPMGISVEARYNIGIVDILGRNTNDTITFDTILANKFFQIGAAYKFDF